MGCQKTEPMYCDKRIHLSCVLDFLADLQSCVSQKHSINHLIGHFTFLWVSLSNLIQQNGPKNQGLTNYSRSIIDSVL